MPRNATRLALSPKLPRAVEIYFAQALRRVVGRFARAVRKHLTAAAIAKFVRPVKSETKTDAWRWDAPGDDDDVSAAIEDEGFDEDMDEDLVHELEALLDEMRAEVERGIEDETEEVERAAHESAKRTVKHSKNEFSRLGIAVKREPETNALISGWVKDTVGRVKGYQREELERIERILREGYGRRAEDLADEILEARLADMTPRRAELIARSSVLRLNGLITAERQTAAGIEAYIWSTSQDERVRPEHAALEGQEFTWESGGDPHEGHPGEAINCRCIAFPILPELSEEEVEETATELT